MDGNDDDEEEEEEKIVTHKQPKKNAPKGNKNNALPDSDEEE